MKPVVLALASAVLLLPAGVQAAQFCSHQPAGRRPPAGFGALQGQTSPGSQSGARRVAAIPGGAPGRSIFPKNES